MRNVTKLGIAVGMAIAFGVLPTSVALALPMDSPDRKSCYWNGKEYDSGKEITVQMPDGSSKKYFCYDGKWYGATATRRPRRPSTRPPGRLRDAEWQAKSLAQ